MPEGNPGKDRNPRSIRAEIEEIKRREILAEAVSQFFDNGYDSTTLESIADALGVTKPYIYSRFASKIDILAAVCLLGAAPAAKTVEFSRTLDGDASRKLGRIMQFFVNLQIEHRMEVTLFFRESNILPPEKSTMIDGHKRAFHRMMCDILEEGKQSGCFVVDDVALTASALGGMASWTFTWFQPSGRRAAPDVARNISILALKAVGVADPETIAD